MYVISVTYDNVSLEEAVVIKTNLIGNETERTLFIFRRNLAGNCNQYKKQTVYFLEIHFLNTGP